MVKKGFPLHPRRRTCEVPSASGVGPSISGQRNIGRGCMAEVTDPLGTQV
jgi:hypothetical protein